ncbi:Zinc transporter [Emydomyces testavorans]|uniref:Zinc transporter n=1 Tax=Emydomyces testavorans TaxID=2070801 RepID=A0AAF0DGJ5_9EURO|nr:Zinc transporter [Emydomyces testavorans]
MALDNDTRGWIMSCVSGVACALGSMIIFVDVIARSCFGKKNFKITESDVFLSSSMSLSAGVLLFTSLYSMLPTSKGYLIRAGYSPGAAAFMLIALFLLGAIVIKIVSSFLHRYIPSHVVACAHSHEEDGKDIENTPDLMNGDTVRPDESTTERTPLLLSPKIAGSKASQAPSTIPADLGVEDAHAAKPNASWSFLSGPIRELVGTRKAVCDENGPCYGFSRACGQECMRVTLLKDPDVFVETGRPTVSERHTLPGPLLAEDARGPAASVCIRPIVDEDLVDQEACVDASAGLDERAFHSTERHNNVAGINQDITESHSTTAYSPLLPDLKKHHHHVPQNAFLSIGLQTSLAIALHKLPEGFITYATNHTNPTLGWSVFVALFVHNITEGFAMALPLYLALRSRLKAVAWSSLLGGVSQPAGAGIAALWIWGARKANTQGGDMVDDNDGVSWAVYGGMFAATAGVMTNVSLQLFSEGLVLSHNQNLCVGFALAGMGILGLTFALTA